MAKNWAIVVGINHYNPNNFAPLQYAKRDAEQVRDFFLKEAQFDQVCFFSDDSPDLRLPNDTEIPTYPSCGNLLSFLSDRFDQPFLSTGDNCWFFFAGHGGRYGDRDYLMPIDANPRGSVPTAAILVSDVRDRLCRCGADNVILILDACRNQGDRASSGIGTEYQQGVITISACSPTQKSWEIDELQQGAFTYALLEALRTPGERNCATVERLDQYLRYRVPELCRQYGRAPAQTPRISADPATKLHFILLPQYATLADIATLKNDAYRAAQIGQNLELAEQIWRRVIAATQGRDEEALQAFSWVRQQRSDRPAVSSPPRSPRSSEGGGRSIDAGSVMQGDRSDQLPRSNFKSVIVSSSPKSSAFPTATGFWKLLIGSFLLYGLSGLLLASANAPLWAVVWAVVWAWVVALAVAIAWAWAVAILGYGRWAAAWAVAVAGILVMVGARIALAVAAGAWLASWIGAVIVAAIGAEVGEEILKSFSKFHTFLILVAIATTGLGSGWLLYLIGSSALGQ